MAPPHALSAVAVREPDAHESPIRSLLSLSPVERQQVRQGFVDGVIPVAAMPR